MTNRATIEITWETASALPDDKVQGMIARAVDELMERLVGYSGLDPAVFAAFNAPDVMADGVG